MTLLAGRNFRPAIGKIGRGDRGGFIGHLLIIYPGAPTTHKAARFPI
jgi:hypothetical protein